jgi:hypothetical protein
MEVVVRTQGAGNGARSRTFHGVCRPGVNDWVVVVGDVEAIDVEPTGVIDRVLSTIDETTFPARLPSSIVAEVHRLVSQMQGAPHRPASLSLIVGRIQFDSCGVWVMLSGTGGAKPAVVRHAGWVEVRGHRSGPSGGDAGLATDDRVGLGPGDALVLCSKALTCGRDGDGTLFGDKVLPDVLVDAAGQSAGWTAEHILQAAKEFCGDGVDDDGLVVVLRVPEAVRHDAANWVSTSTGIPLDDLDLPRYPVWTEQDDAWGRPLVPPREAVVRLAPEPPSVPALRRLLRRLLHSWRLGFLADGDIELLATEMATNAFARSASPVTVIVKYTGAVIRVEIGDGERAPRGRRRHEFDELRGHRLALVESLASDWGVSTTATGTRVWFEVGTLTPP